MQRLIIVAALALSCAPPSGGGGRADGTGAPGSRTQVLTRLTRSAPCSTIQ